MAWVNILDKSGGDVALASDFNQLMENARILGGNGTSAPSSDIETLNTDVSNSKKFTTKTVTSSTYTVTNADIQDYGAIEFDTTSNAIVVTLPDRATNVGYRIKLKHSIQGGTNLLTINRAGADTITQDLLTSMKLPVVDDYIDFYSSSITGNWEILDESMTCQLWLHTSAGAGSTDTAIEQFTTSVENIGNMFSENHSTGYNAGVEGLEITINRTGQYTFTYTAIFSSAQYFGFSLNSAQLTTNMLTITDADRLSPSYTAAGNGVGSASITLYLSKNDIIRPHSVTGGPSSGIDKMATFEASYVGQ